MDASHIIGLECCMLWKFGLASFLTISDNFCFQMHVVKDGKTEANNHFNVRAMI